MKLINNDQTLKIEDPQRTIHKGIVVSVDDPHRRGRVKCIIPNMFEEEDTDSLPWCYPLGSLASFTVPSIDDELIIEFPFGVRYMPVYTGKWETSRSHNIISDENYPHSILMPLGDNSWVRCDTDQDTLEYKHPSGTFIYIDQSGGVFINSEGDTGIRSKGFLYLGGDKGVFLESEEGNLGIGSGMNISVHGTSNIELKTAGNISMQSVGINSTQASVVMHNCGFTNVVSALVSTVIKTIGSTIKVSMDTIGKKLEVVQKTADAKRDKLKGIK